MPLVPLSQINIFTNTLFIINIVTFYNLDYINLTEGFPLKGNTIKYINDVEKDSLKIHIQNFGVSKCLFFL